MRRLEACPPHQTDCWWAQKAMDGRTDWSKDLNDFVEELQSIRKSNIWIASLFRQWDCQMLLYFVYCWTTHTHFPCCSNDIINSISVNCHFCITFYKSVYIFLLGYVCPGKTEFAEQHPCPRGTYNNETQAMNFTACQPCDGGKFCAHYGLPSPSGIDQRVWGVGRPRIEMYHKVVQ